LGRLPAITIAQALTVGSKQIKD